MEARCAQLSANDESSFGLSERTVQTCDFISKGSISVQLLVLKPFFKEGTPSCSDFKCTMSPLSPLDEMEKK